MKNQGGLICNMVLTCEYFGIEPYNVTVELASLRENVSLRAVLSRSNGIISLNPLESNGSDGWGQDYVDYQLKGNGWMATTNTDFEGFGLESVYALDSPIGRELTCLKESRRKNN